jgi:transcriptional regulator with XRE-family HTH domain
MAGQDTFARRLTAVREAAGVTQYRLAQLSGISKQAISRLELGETRPAWETVQALAAALGASCEAFSTSVNLPTAAVPGKPGRPPKSPPSTAPGAELEVKKPSRRGRKGK